MRNWLQQHNASMGHTCADAHSMGCGDMSCPSSRAFQAANLIMHQAMAVNYTCNAEVDFVQGMIPHHQGAVDMCAVLIASHTGDAYLEALCANVTALQRAEIVWQNRWLESVNVPPGASCFHGVLPEPVCADTLPIMDACHDHGVCSCGNLACDSTVNVSGGQLQVNEVCSASCGQCQASPGPQMIMQHLLAFGASSATTMQHGGHGGHNMDASSSGTTHMGMHGASSPQVDSPSSASSDDSTSTTLWIILGCVAVGVMVAVIAVILVVMKRPSADIAVRKEDQAVVPTVSLEGKSVEKTEDELRVQVGASIANEEQEPLSPSTRACAECA